MSRYACYDDDDDRLPEGMVRIGYDAETQIYTYRDTADGSTWEGEPGNRYGTLHKMNNGPPSRILSSPNGPDLDNPSEATINFLRHSQGGAGVHAGEDGHFRREPAGWRQEYMPLLNFLLIIFLFLAGVYWFLH